MEGKNRLVSGQYIYYINLLRTRLGGSYLSNIDLQDDLAKYGKVERVLLLDEFSRNKYSEVLPDILKQKNILDNTWASESMPNKNQITNCFKKLDNKIIYDKCKVIIILGHESLVWLVPLLKEKSKQILIFLIHHGTPTHILDNLDIGFKRKFFKDLELVDLIITVSPHLSRIIYSHIDKDIITIPNLPNFPDTRPKTKPEKAGLNILQVSTMRELKRPLDGINLVKEIQKKDSSVHLTYVGSGELTHEWLKSAEPLGKNIKYIDFLGRNEIMELIIYHDFLFLPSNAEGLPRVVVESMLCGTPVVVSRGANGSQLVKDGENGIEFQTGNIEQAAFRIMELFSNRDAYNDMIFKGYQTSKEIFDLRSKSIDLILKKINDCMPGWRE